MSKPDNYYIAVKAFIRKDRSILLCKDIAGEYDLPGGRIDIDEFDLPFDNILEREIYEELGKDIRFENNGIVCIFRHRRPEITENKEEIRIFMIGFEVNYLGGDIKLSNEHSEYAWVRLDKAERYLNRGQKEGLKKYLKYLEGDRKKIIY